MGWKVWGRKVRAGMERLTSALAAASNENACARTKGGGQSVVTGRRSGV